MLTSSIRTAGPATILGILLGAAVATGDVVTDANTKAAEIASTIKATPVAVRVMALVQVSVFDALQSIQPRYRPLISTPSAAPGASIDAAVASATRTVLLALVPDQRERIEADYQTALAAVPDGPARGDGIAAGERAANAALAARMKDGADAPQSYRPATSPGVYVPTARPLTPHWGTRTPWLLKTGKQIRPAAPPSLESVTWRRDLAEVRSVGARTSTTRTAEQSKVAKFWDTTSPSVYWPVVRSVATARTADAAENARLLAEAAVAMDDALIAVFDAKYAYGFWRPITAIRSGGDPGWEPMIETPMHPEYPCAHCIVSAAVGRVLESAIGTGPSPTLRSTSPTGEGIERTWVSPAEFVREVSEARICAGVHYRNSTEVGQRMGRQIGEIAERRFDGLRSSSPETAGTMAR